MPTFVVRKIGAVTWRKFRHRADQRGWPYRWVLLELIEAFADGRFTPTPVRPDTEPQKDKPIDEGPKWEI